MINQNQCKSRFSVTVPKETTYGCLRVAKLQTLGHRKRASCFCHALHITKPQGITINNRIKLQMEGKPSSVPRHSCWLVGELHGRHVDIPPSFLDKTNQLGVDFFCSSLPWMSWNRSGLCAYLPLSDSWSNASPFSRTLGCNAALVTFVFPELNVRIVVGWRSPATVESSEGVNRHTV